MNDYSGDNLEGDFAVNMPYGVALTYLEVLTDFFTIIGWKGISYRAIFPLQSTHIAYNPWTMYPTYHSQHPNLTPSWSRFWPGKAWYLSTDTIQTSVRLTYIYMMYNWGQRPNTILSETRDTTTSMVRWLIWREWMAILEVLKSWGRFCNKYAVWCCINLFRSLKRLLYYHWMKRDQLWSYFPLQSSHTAYNSCTMYPTYHSQTAQSVAKLKQ